LTSNMITVNDFSLPYKQGMTLMDALQEAAIDIHGLNLITVNGVFAASDTYNTHLLSDGDTIISMKIVSGG